MSQTLEQPSTRPPASDPFPSAAVSQTEDALEASPRGGVRRTLRTVVGLLPPVVVTAGLAAVGWYGHHHDWKLPSAASLSSEPMAITDSVWCASHGVPENECIVCQPGLIEDAPSLTFCNEHGVHGCVLCNPKLAQTKAPFVTSDDERERVANALKLRPRIDNLSISTSPGTRIQFASIASMNKVGVDVEPVIRDRVVESVSAAGEIRYDETKSAIVSPQTDGVVKQIDVAIGDWVDTGDLLVLLDSSEAGRLKTELVAAIADEQLRRKTVDRIRPLAGGAVAGKRLLESEVDLQQATSEVDRIVGSLANLGVTVPIDRVRHLEGEQRERAVRQSGLSLLDTELLPKNLNEGNLIAVTAPLAGQIVSRETTLGEVVDRGSQMFRIVDTRTVWLDLRVPAEDASLIQVGQTTRFQPDGSDQWREGSVTWISTETDPQTRTVRVRAELTNEDQNLRHESFGRGQVVLRDDPDALLVPESSVQWDGTGHLVFVRDARFFEQDRPKFFIARSVRVGVKQDGMAEIIAGVVPGEVVASTGGDVLRAQLLRSNLGAGCTCGH